MDVQSLQAKFRDELDLRACAEDRATHSADRMGVRTFSSIVCEAVLLENTSTQTANADGPKTKYDELEHGLRRRHRSFGGDAEFLVKPVIGGRGSEA